MADKQPRPRSTPGPAIAPRKPRGAHIEETDLMRALEADPASAMAGLTDETQADWEAEAPLLARRMLEAEDASLGKS